MYLEEADHVHDAHIVHEIRLTVAVEGCAIGLRVRIRKSRDKDLGYRVRVRNGLGLLVIFEFYYRVNASTLGYTQNTHTHTHTHTHTVTHNAPHLSRTQLGPYILFRPTIAGQWNNS